MADNKVLELREALLECQKELAGQRQLYELLKRQMGQLEIEKSQLANTISSKDMLVDKLKEEIIIVNKLGIKNNQNNQTSQSDPRQEARSEEEFKRLKGIAEQLKDAQVDAERARMEGLYKDREYLQLKDQLADALEAKNQALRQADVTRFENQKLKDEQNKFIEDLNDMRTIYESQITQLSPKN